MAIFKKEIKISVKAVLVGGGVDLLLSIILSSLISTYVAITNGLSDGKPEVVWTMVRNIIHQSSLLFGISTALGLMSSILGGYVAARIADEDEVENAIAASLVLVGIGVYSLIVGDSDSAPLEMFGIAITPFFYRLGAQVRVREKKNRGTK